MRWNILELVPELLYVEIDDKFRNYIFKKAINKAGSGRKVAKEFSIHSTSLVNWQGGKGSFPFNFLRKLCKRVNIDVDVAKKHIIGVGVRNVGIRIKYPKLIIKFDNSMARLLGNICGDGCIRNNFVVSYTNLENNLVKEFIKNAKNVFGDINYHVYKSSDKTINVNLPNIIGIILTKCFGNIKNKILPKDLFLKNQKLIGDFIGAFFDDEGHINIDRKNLEIQITQPYTLKIIKNLLFQLGVNSSKIKKKKNRDRSIWRLCIYRRKNFVKFSENIKLKHRKKIKLLRYLIKSYTSRFSKYELGEALIEKLGERYYTASELAKKINISHATICKTLAKLEKEGITKRFSITLNDKNGRPYKVSRWCLI